MQADLLPSAMKKQLPANLDATQPLPAFHRGTEARLVLVKWVRWFFVDHCEIPGFHVRLPFLPLTKQHYYWQCIQAIQIRAAQGLGRISG